MNGKIINTIAFLSGASVGVVITYAIMKNACNERVNTAIDEMKHYASEKEKNQKEENSIAKEDVQKIATAAINKPDIFNYSNVSQKLGYEKPEKELDSFEPYLISKEQFDEGDYNNSFLIYYSDGCLIDAGDREVDIEDIGEELLKHFGEEDDPDLIHVRNDEYEIDYEIIRDERTYLEVGGKGVSEDEDYDDDYEDE